MKNSCLTLLILVLFSVQSKVSRAQFTAACCSKSSTTEFAMLGKSESFQNAHLAPVPFHFVPSSGKMITVAAADGKNASGFEIRSQKPSKNYLFVLQEWWGLNDYIKQEAQNLAEELGNVHVIALDLYDGKVATNAEEAGLFMKEAKEERIRTIINAFISHVGAEAQIQTIGWCFGGGWSLQASIMAGDKAVGCVMYYGSPEKDKEKLYALKAPVLGIFAGKDGWISPEVVAEFEKNMRELEKTVTIKTYDAEHAFANPSNPKFNREATEDAHRLAVAFLREHIK